MIKEFTYHKHTGEFTKDETSKLVGKINKDGDVVIRFMSKYRLASQLAWLWEFGKYSFHELEHINGNKQDNRISNLDPIFKISNLPVHKGEIKPKRESRLSRRNVKK